MRNTFEKIRLKSRFEIPSEWLTIRTVEMHTCGEPLRVILEGFPALKGNSVLEKRRYLMDNYDHLRRTTMFEPRGHADMYGCLLVEPNDEEGDFGIIFLHNEGYSTMCGHAIIAISKLAFEMDWINAIEGDNKIYIDAPCGRITSTVNFNEGKLNNISFQCVPSFVQALDLGIVTHDYGKIVYDLAYGGAYYAYIDLDKNEFDFDLTEKNYRHIIQAGIEIKKQLVSTGPDIIHPFETDLSFLYGTIFVQSSDIPGIHSRNVCVFADGEVDRCPTGSGLSGRLALHYKRKEISVGELIKVESIIGSTFTGRVVREQMFGDTNAVIPEVSGTAHITGSNTICIDPTDELKNGFFLR